MVIEGVPFQCIRLARSGESAACVPKGAKARNHPPIPESGEIAWKAATKRWSGIGSVYFRLFLQIWSVIVGVVEGERC
jgi:hypothetical protein